MSTVQKVRYALAAVVAVTAIGLMVAGNILTGILCLVGAVLLLPILYERLLIESNDVQFLSPTIFLAVALFSFMMFSAIPQSYELPLKTVYAPAAQITTTSVLTTTAKTTMEKATTTTATTSVVLTTTTKTVVFTTTAAALTTVTETVAEPIRTTTIPPVAVITTTETTQSVLFTSETVYRTPSGKRYHLNPTCGGKNSYSVTYDQAIDADLTPCKKCAGG